jgi:type IV secretory pathway ATPase VirB11/archaellum biosynthesis ATPase
VVNTLRYLGIHVHPSHLNKIAPNIRVAKKKILSKKDLYSTAADYSMTAWKKLRTWLDKQMIN